MKTQGIILVGIIILSAFLVPIWGAEEKFPSKPIHIWVGFAAGGSSDTLTRVLSSVAEKTLGQSIVVENKPGGGGALCFGLLKSAKPDGYTLGSSTDTALTRTPHITKVEYDAKGDFTPIIRLGIARIGVVVRSDSPFKKFQDLIEYARKNPGQLTVGLPGSGTSTHLGMGKIALTEKVKFQYVQFQGSAPTITAILGGHVMCASTVSTTFTPHVKAGTLRILLMFDPEGLEAFPEVPTIEKLGYDFKLPTAELIAAPNGVPKSIKDKLVVAFYEAMKSPEFLTVARQQELILPTPLVGEDLDKWLKSAFDFYGTLIKDMELQKK